MENKPCVFCRSLTDRRELVNQVNVAICERCHVYTVPNQKKDQKLAKKAPGLSKK